METLHDAEGLVAIWGGAIDQLKDDFAVLAAVSEDHDQRAYSEYAFVLFFFFSALGPR